LRELWPLVPARYPKKAAVHELSAECSGAQGHLLLAQKTDNEDSLKLAHFIATNPEDALPIVRTPDTNTEYLRQLVRARTEIVRQLRSKKCRFYGLCIQAVINGVRKGDLRTAEYVAEIAQKLPQSWQIFAQMIVEQQQLFRAQLAALALHGYGIP
jgi:transposase